METQSVTPENQEDRLRVPIDSSAFEYVKKILQPVYAEELRQAQQDGREEEFKTQRISLLDLDIKRQLILSNGELPSNPYLNLSKRDVKFIEDLAYSQPSGNLEDMGRRKGSIGHLAMAYERTHRGHKKTIPRQHQNLASRVRNLFKRR